MGCCVPVGRGSLRGLKIFGRLFSRKTERHKISLISPEKLAYYSRTATCKMTQDHPALRRVVFLSLKTAKKMAGRRGEKAFY
nr:MAG TPA: hypothetical protein [Caudoviricetes sp.]